MENPLRLIAIGESTGLVLPDELLQRLGVGPGDKLYAVETSRGVELSAHDPQFAAEVEEAERVMREERAVLKKLAE